jgi:glycosyltransferase involved in cell wall biosynthesis
MNIVQLTPGAGGMYCGNCFRDNALVAELRRAGHDALMVPLYLPMTLDEEDSSAGTPIFFSGINVYLDQKSALFRHAPAWVHRLLAAPRLLKWAAGRAAKTRAEDVGELTLSMFRGEQGHQARELEELIAWLKRHSRPDVVCLSNALLVGMARRLKAEFGVPLICMLQGEDSFLDGLPPAHRDRAWRLMAERARDVDRFVAPSHYFGERMQHRLGLPEERVQVVFNGIHLAGYTAAPAHEPPVLGYFARMCREKGLDTLVEAFVALRKRDRVKGLRLRVGGGCGPSDQPFVDGLRARLRAEGLDGEAEFHPNLDRAAKIEFYRSLSAFSVPALYGEAFGLYVIEALAAGVPVVQPRHAAFTEILEATGGGKLCEPGNPLALAEAIERLLGKPEEARALGEAGRQAVLRDFTAERMARKMLAVHADVTGKPAG